MPANRMPLPHPRVPVAALLLLCAAPLQAQYDDRIWGRVFTNGGEVHEGFIRLVRWRAAASWTDVLSASKKIPEEHYQDWLDATRDGEPHVGTVELKGYRITWDSKHPSFARPQLSGIRFGHVAVLAVGEEGEIRVVTRSRQGTELGLSPEAYRAITVGEGAEGFIMVRTSNDMQLRVESEGRSVQVRGRDLERIEFGASPSGAAPPSGRLYGTVEDRTGRSFTGFVTWDRRRILESGSLETYWEDVPQLANPWESDKYKRSIRFSEIRSLERTPCFAKVTLKSDSVVELCDEPFEGDPWVRISDPALGYVEVKWDAVRTLRFEPSPGLQGYDAFDGGRPLSGTVVTVDGDEITGRIRWDADEEWSWELLQGSSDDVEFSIEFGNVAHIEREGADSARVSLQDGRLFHLTGGYDVGRDNRGIFIFPAPADGAPAGASAAKWRYVAWEEFREVRFHPIEDQGAGS
ncbi:MAG: hypothetical protein OXU69_15490 [Gemmatimonadota bacterium]|nr:hypothetical protein [Gemmatimonadota bacterium]